MNLCYLIPFTLALIFYSLPPSLSEPKRLTLVSWLFLAIAMTFPCKDVFGYAVRRIVEIAERVRAESLIVAVFDIFSHNLLVLMLCALIGKAYLGFTIGLTGIISREIASGYPLNVLLGAHTLLELYAYSLATTRRKRELVKATLYLLIAAAFEVIAIRF